MSFIHFIRLVLRNLKWLIIVPATIAASIFYFTRHEKKVYSSETVIYTGIASGSSLNENAKVDYLSVSNAFDNLLSVINSRETKEEVALQLLSEHLFLEKHDPEKLGWGAYAELKSLFPDSLRKKMVRPTIPETFNAVELYMQRSDDNLIYKILNSFNPYYSLSALQNVKASRVNSSDLIKIAYETNDPLICKHTLEILIDVFMRKNRLLKEGRTESVVAYFEKQTKDAYSRLDSAEQNFLDFNKTNDIINYYDQTKAVAGQRENLYALDHSLQMDEKAAENSLATIDENIKGRVHQSLYGSEIINARERLSEVYNKITLNEVVGDKNSDRQQRLDSLKRLASGIESNLQSSLEKLYVESNTPNGIPTKQVLDEWLNSTLAFKSSKAKLSVMDKRKKAFSEEYKRYAPLGAMLKKIERQIGVLEKEYLDYLHSLSVARLSQQNNELTTKLTIVDPPFLPISPNASKRKILIVVGFLVGFILVLAVILSRALVNKTLLEPLRAKKIIGIPLLGIYPLLKEKPVFLAKARLRLIQQLLSKVNIKDAPLMLGFFSIQKSEGKTTVIDMIYDELTSLGYKVERHLRNSDLIKDVKPETDIVLIEYPALDEMVMKPGFIRDLHLAFLVSRANRVWNKIDNELLALFSKTTGNTPYLILNGVHTDFAEEYIGDVPKDRLAVRSMGKRLLRFQFGSRKAFNNN